MQRYVCVYISTIYILAVIYLYCSLADRSSNNIKNNNSNNNNNNIINNNNNNNNNNNINNNNNNINDLTQWPSLSSKSPQHQH